VSESERVIEMKRRGEGREESAFGTLHQQEIFFL
jgi:hypothetical protein